MHDPPGEILETGLKLLLIHAFVKFPGRACELFARHVPALFRGEVKRVPPTLARRGFPQIIKMVEAARCPDK
jgi:hypothetical protein